MTFAVQGSYDSLNPLIVKGEPADGVRDYVYESLLARANDEPFTLYGLIAERVETPRRPKLRRVHAEPSRRSSQMATPITVDDVIFSHALLRDHGRPNHRSYYKKVVKVEQTGERKVRFTFDQSGDREMPLIMGLMPVLPKHLIDPDQFEKTTLNAARRQRPLHHCQGRPRQDRSPSSAIPTIGDAISRSIAGSTISTKSASTIIATRLDVRGVQVGPGAACATRTTRRAGRKSYDFPATRDGRVVKEELPVETPAGMSALVFNTRRPLFADQRVREALIRLFDFEWVNRTLYHGQYARTRKLFRALGSILAWSPG